MKSSAETKGTNTLHSKWLVLLAACLGNLVLTLDSGVIGISYPALAEAFDTDTSTVLWVSVAFWVTGVGLVMTVGWLGDVGGRRLSYTLGFVLFSVALGLSAATSGALAANRRPHIHGPWVSYGARRRERNNPR